MKIKFVNFGPHTRELVHVADMIAGNGQGKTTLLNGYLWALTGKTLGGYEPIKQGTPDGETTEVCLYEFGGLHEIRRTTANAGGTTLYVDGNVMTQSEFAKQLAGRGIDIDFVALCCDANALTSDALTSDDLQKLLIRAEVMDGGEIEALRKEAANVRKSMKQAEMYSLANVAIPERTVSRPSEAERYLVETFDDYTRTVQIGVQTVCPMCKQVISESERYARQNAYDEAKRFTDEKRAEYERIRDQVNAYNAESNAIDDARRITENATRAREDVLRYGTRLREIDEQIRDLRAKSVRADLPEGVELVTEQKLKNGSTKSVCALTWNGIPLKSVNRAKRIEICVRILAQARDRAGMRSIPIWIDNAEAVQGLQDIENVIRLVVG